ncbi:unnamed protein product [Paramecium sonneborni]|uniref:Uncharacterized protein n=1 Tax=Paramecium sonneborni TaxID=65129 RepID=A0A8S1QW73_9CILI|nr:unnamed protein product [Paramecium sonneborni]
MLLTIYRNHPKKTLLFLILLFGGITYKFRSHLFNAFLQKMQSKLTKEMQLQMEKGQRINTKLDQIQQIVDEFYDNKGFLNTISTILNLEEITTIGNKLKQNKESTQEQKSLMYQTMNQQFLIFEVSTIILLKKSECLLLLSKILILTITVEEEQIFIQNLLEQIQQTILNQQYLQIVAIIQEEFTRDPLKYNYDKQANLKEIIKNLVQLCQKEFMENKFHQLIQNKCREEFKQKIIQFQQYYQGQNLKTIQEQSKQLVEHLIKVNNSLAVQTFSNYSISYNYQKLDNRIQLIPQINEINNQILIKQLIKHHQVIKEEFYAKESIQNNSNYYQKILKQSLKIKEEQSAQNNLQSDNNLIQIQKVLHEFKISEILKQSQNQIIRKLIFGMELDETPSSQKQSLGQLAQGI